MASIVVARCHRTALNSDGCQFLRPVSGVVAYRGLACDGLGCRLPRNFRALSGGLVVAGSSSSGAVPIADAPNSGGESNGHFVAPRANWNYRPGAVLTICAQHRTFNPVTGRSRSCRGRRARLLDNSDGGIVTPSAFAVLRLITSSILVGCSGGLMLLEDLVDVGRGAPGRGMSISNAESE